jgi:hypothetical protein
MVIILMILKGTLKKYFIDLGPFCHFIYLIGPPKQCSYEEKPIQIPENANFAEFCGILRNFADRKSGPPKIGPPEIGPFVICLSRICAHEIGTP